MITGFQFRACFHRLAFRSKVFREPVLKYFKLDLRVSQCFSNVNYLLETTDDKAKLAFLPLNHKSYLHSESFSLYVKPKLMLLCVRYE